jgi:hypothetical protein
MNLLLIFLALLLALVPAVEAVRVGCPPRLCFTLTGSQLTDASADV